VRHARLAARPRADELRRSQPEWIRHEQAAEPVVRQAIEAGIVFAATLELTRDEIAAREGRT
jgi:hypothetical protein